MKYAWKEILVEYDVDGNPVEPSFDAPALSGEMPSGGWPPFRTGDGPVTGLNREGTQEGESTGNCTPQDLVWAMDIDKYSVVDYIFTPMSQEDADALQLQKDKNEALSQMTSDIDAKGDSENAKDFPYTKDAIDYLFKSDKSSIQGTKNAILGAVDGSVAIPTFRGDANEGTWKCAEATTGEIVFVPFTIDEFTLFADEYYMRWSDNFTTYSNHVDAVTVIANDPESTVEDITSYDFSQGWV